MGRHEAPASVATFDQAVSDYVTGRAKELVREFDTWKDAPVALGYTDQEAYQRMVNINAWVGAAAEILRELTRDA